MEAEEVVLVVNASHADEVVDVVVEVFDLYLGPAVCGVGLVCNLVSLLVLLQPGLQDWPYTYLTGMTCTNLGTMTLSFVYLVFAESHSRVWNFYTVYIFYPFTNICSHSSIWIVLMLTVERFLFVRYPLWARDRCNRRSAKIKISVILLVMFVINLSRFFQFRVVELPGNNGTAVVNVGGASTFFLVMNWFHSITINFGPLLVLSFCNVYLVMAVRRALSRQSTYSTDLGSAKFHLSADHARLTRTLIAVVFLFIICLLPSAFADRPIAYRLFGRGQDEASFIRRADLRILQSVSNFLSWTGNAGLFFVYCACNRRFTEAASELAARLAGTCRSGSSRVKADALKMTSVATENQCHVTIFTEGSLANEEASSPMHEAE